MNLLYSKILPLTLPIILAACEMPGGMQKRADAVDAVSTTRAMASFLESKSSLVRSSGEATYVRLHELFPQAPLVAEDFAPKDSGGGGIMGAFGQEDRPSNALALIALRIQSATLCKDHLSTSKIFESLSGDPAPSDEAVKFALLAARNIWLDLYTEDRPEVQELASLYRKVKSLPGTPDIAKRAVCQAALLSPQFWIGNSGKLDVIKKLALEIGRRTPTRQELKDFSDGKFTLSSFIKKLQSEPGFFNAMKTYHRLWLGTREFNRLDAGDPRDLGDHTAFNRGAGWYAGVQFQLGSPEGGIPKLILTDNSSSTYPAVTYPHRPNLEPFQKASFDPTSDIIVFEHRQQAGEILPGIHFMGGWYLEANSSRFLQYLQEIGSLPSSADVSDATRTAFLTSLCPTRFDVTLFDSTKEFWRECDGMVQIGLPKRDKVLEDITSQVPWGTQSVTQPLLGLGSQTGNTGPFFLSGAEITQVQTALTNYSEALKYFNSRPQTRQSVAEISGRQSLNAFKKQQWEARVQGLEDPNEAYYRVKLSDLRKQYISDDVTLIPSVANIPHPLKDFNLSNRVVRRHGRITNQWQDSWSRIKTFWAEQDAYVDNTLGRFFASCAYRPIADPLVASHAELNTEGVNRERTARSTYPPSFYSAPAISPLHLSRFSCVDQGGPSSAPLRYTSQGSTNDANPVATFAQINVSQNPGVPLGPEGQAILRLNQDIREEANRLINHVLITSRPYSEIFTAPYTCAGFEYFAFMRMRGQYVPFSGFMEDSRNEFNRLDNCQLAPNDPAQTTIASFPIKKITQDSLGTASLHWFKSSLDTLPTIFDELAKGNTTTDNTGLDEMKRTGLLPAKKMSGILNMAAAIAQVPKARTLAARYFIRFLCDGPAERYDEMPKNNTSSMSSSDVARYIPGSAKDHLRPECYSCHRNLDPLSSSLSSSFVPKFGTKYETLGEMLHYPDPQGSEEIGINGMIGGAKKGEGLFLGKPITGGVQEVGQVLTQSHSFSKCVVRKTFMNLMGREESIE